MENLLDCDLEYDKNFDKIEHFCLHSEMKPYVGPLYNQFKVLLIGESHYINDYEEDFLDGWYNKNTMSFNWKSPDHMAWFNTRKVVNDFLECKYTASSFFTHPTKILSDILDREWGITLPDDRKAFLCVAFCNYFQRPELKAKGGFRPKSDDREKSKKIIQQIIDLLKPRKVIFISKKAYQSFADKSGTSLIEYTVHPCCPWFNRDGGVRGSAKLKEIYTEYLKSFSKDDIEDIKKRISKICF